MVITETERGWVRASDESAVVSWATGFGGKSTWSIFWISPSSLASAIEENFTKFKFIKDTLTRAFKDHWLKPFFGRSPSISPWGQPADVLFQVVSGPIIAVINKTQHHMDSPRSRIAFVSFSSRSKFISFPPELFASRSNFFVQTIPSSPSSSFLQFTFTAFGWSRATFLFYKLGLTKNDFYPDIRPHIIIPLKNARKSSRERAGSPLAKVIISVAGNFISKIRLLSSLRIILFITHGIV